AKGADAAARDKRQITSLHLASQGGKEEILENGTDVVARDGQKQGPSPRKGDANRDNATQIEQEIWGPGPANHEAVAQLLLDNSVEVNARDEQGRSPLDFAHRQRYKPMIQLLLKNGAMRGRQRSIESLWQEALRAKARVENVYVR